MNTRKETPQTEGGKVLFNCLEGEVLFSRNEFNDEDLGIGSDSLIGDLIGEILGFLTFVAIIYWLGDKLSELRDWLSEWWEDITERRRAKGVGSKE
jgi:hypothetical protein